MPALISPGGRFAGEFFLQRVESGRIPLGNRAPQEIEESLYQYPAAAEAWRDRRTGQLFRRGRGGVRDTAARRAGDGVDRFCTALFGGLPVRGRIVFLPASPEGVTGKGAAAVLEKPATS